MRLLHSSFVLGHSFVIGHSSFVILIMAITVSRPKLNWSEKLYLPAIVSGLAITIKHFKNMLLGRTKVAIILRTVLLPEPEGPSRATNSPRRTPKDTSRTASIAVPAN